MFWKRGRHCLCCHEWFRGRRWICDPCLGDLPWAQPGCVQCGLSTPTPGICGQCLQQEPAYDRTIALFDYQTPINHYINAFKFKTELVYARFFAEQLGQKLRAEYVDRPWPQVLLPMPLHDQRLKSRGYNQALVLGRYLSKQIPVTVNKAWCRRVKLTQPQSQLNASQRRRNLHHAFQLKSQKSIPHVAILDDVMTTGHTVNELAKLLKNSGFVQQVDVWCLARPQVGHGRLR